MAEVDRAHGVILAGGRGTRFWPLSRRAQPKQLLDLTGSGSLLALTAERLAPVIPPQRQWVITSSELVDAVAECVPQIPPEQIIAEPVGRNTAPAVGLAAAVLDAQAPGTPFCVLPSDHLITDVEQFQALLGRGLTLAARSPWLLTFGIEPARAETGYGYIHRGDPIPDTDGAYRALGFMEKPDLETAERYVASGEYLWNSGMFLWRSDVVLAGLSQHLPTTAAAMVTAAQTRPGTDGWAGALEKAYAAADTISVDYALLEKADNVAVLPASFGWNDVGHWLAMRELWPADGDQNRHLGSILAMDTKECIVYSPDRLTALLGVKDLVVVQTADVTLVCSADRVQDVKKLLEQLENSGDQRFS